MTIYFRLKNFYNSSCIIITQIRSKRNVTRPFSNVFNYIKTTTNQNEMHQTWSDRTVFWTLFLQFNQTQSLFLGHSVFLCVLKKDLFKKCSGLYKYISRSYFCVKVKTKPFVVRWFIPLIHISPMTEFIVLCNWTTWIVFHISWVMTFDVTNTNELCT